MKFKTKKQLEREIEKGGRMYTKDFQDIGELKAQLNQHNQIVEILKSYKQKIKESFPDELDFENKFEELLKRLEGDI